VSPNDGDVPALGLVVGQPIPVGVVQRRVGRRVSDEVRLVARCVGRHSVDGVLFAVWHAVVVRVGVVPVRAERLRVNDIALTSAQYHRILVLVGFVLPGVPEAVAVGVGPFGDLQPRRDIVRGDGHVDISPGLEFRRVQFLSDGPDVSTRLSMVSETLL